MEEFDKMLKSMAEKEECAVPEAFDDRMRKVLDSLPSRAGKKGRVW